MALKVFNTLKGEKETFKPLKDSKVNMFVCGPTVYDYPHLGHARTYISYDIIAKWLRYKGYEVNFLMNITDVDDKIIRRAKETGISPMKLASNFEKIFYEDMAAIGVNSIDTFARASEHIAEIEKQIFRLVENGYAYATSTGIYFDITKFSDYGKLSHQNLKELKKHRIEQDATKKHLQDFSLWKVTDPSEVPKWTLKVDLLLPQERINFVLGEGSEKYVKIENGKLKISMPGRPGWHIEDTAIAEKYFGSRYDLHGGGHDLIFPHHESEIAQMEASSGKKPFVKYWIHTGFLTVNGQKMSKSLKNFTTIRDVLKEYDAEVLRLFFASSIYRSQVDYNFDNLKQSKTNLERLYNTLEIIKSSQIGKENASPLFRELRGIRSNFEKAMDDDFNTPDALSILFDASSKINKFLSEYKISSEEMAKIEREFHELAGVFGLLRKELVTEDISEETKALIQKREKFREAKMFAEADQIREELKRRGIVIDDTQSGPRQKPKKG